MLTVHGRHYENGEPVQIHIDGERIAAIEPAWPPRGSAAWPYVAPGLFDLQINGRGGIWFGKTGITADEVLGVLKSHFRFGLTRLCPTLITNSFEGLAGGFAAIREACERERWADRLVPGCRIRLVTLAPELPGAVEYIQRAVAERVVISIGHTAAEPEQIAAAVD